VTGETASSPLLLLRSPLAAQSSCASHRMKLTALVLCGMSHSNHLTHFIQFEPSCRLCFHYFVFLLLVCDELLKPCRNFTLKMSSDVRDGFIGFSHEHRDCIVRKGVSGGAFG
jgi:hypothetical protein